MIFGHSEINSLIKSGCKEIYLVIGHNGDKIRSKISNTKVTIINNPNYESGKSSSIIRGMKSIDKSIESLIIVGVDQPRPIWFYEKIIKFHNKSISVISSPINNKKRQLFGERSRKIAEENFDLEVISKMYIKFYNEVIENSFKNSDKR